MADNPTVNGVIVAGDDVGSGVIVQRVKPQYGIDGAGVDVESAKPLPAGHHRNSACVQVASGTFTVAVADGTNAKDGPAVTLPAVELGLGQAVGVIVRNTSNKALDLRLKHQYTDPNGGATRYATHATKSGGVYASIPPIASEPDGVYVVFDGGLTLVGAKFVANAQAAVDATYTISLLAWIKNS